MLASELCAQILAGAYVPAMFRNTGLDAAVHESMAAVRVVVPQRFAAPRPSKPRACFERILQWTEEDEEEDVSPREAGDGAYSNRHEYLRHGGKFTARVLKMAQRVVDWNKDDNDAWAQADPRTSNQAPQWPPAPELIRKPPMWGVQAQLAPLDGFVNVGVESSIPGGFAPLTTIGEPFQGHHNSGSTRRRASRPGYYIGHDGNEWPLPPREFMTSPFFDSPEFKSPQFDQTALTGRDASIDARVGQERVSPAGSTSTVSSTLVVTPPEQYVGCAPGKSSIQGPVVRREIHRRKEVRRRVDWRTDASGSALQLDLGINKSKPSPGLTRRGTPHVKAGVFLGTSGNLWPLPPDDSLLGPGVLRKGSHPRKG